MAFALDSQTIAVRGADSGAGLTHRQDPTTITSCISQAMPVNYFPGPLSFFFFFFSSPHCLRRALWDGCDVMSTEKAIYSPFVLLRSFKKANSLRAWKQAGEARLGVGGGWVR